MSVHVYARATKLPDVCGRVDYVTSPDRQENLMATSSTVEDPQYWQRLSHDSQIAYRQAGGKKEKTKCCEAREIVGDLPDSAKDRDLNEVAEKLAADFKRRTGHDCLVGIHYNKKQNNLHFHLVYSERVLLPEPEIQVADRNAWIDENGIRKRTKKEILDENGQLRPGCSIVPKGAVISERHFGDKDPMFADMGWLYSYKHDLAEWINQEIDPDEKREVFDKFGPYLAQKHIGKGVSKAKKEAIEDWNRAVKAFNGLVKEGIITTEFAIEKKSQIALAPDQTKELEAIIAEAYCDTFSDLTPEESAAYEKMVTATGQEARTKTGPKEDLKRKLREAHRKASLAWQAYRLSEPGSADRTVLLAEARGASAEISRLEKKLGYDRPITTKDRQRAVWDTYAANKNAVIESGDPQRLKNLAHEKKAAAWKDYQRKKADYERLTGVWEKKSNGRWVKVKPIVKIDPGEIARAEMQMGLALAGYKVACKEIEAFNQARKIEADFRSFALDQAANPAVSDADAEKARKKFEEAAERLRKPSKEVCLQVKRELKALKKDHRTKEEARKAELEKEKENTSFAGGGAGGDR